MTNGQGLEACFEYDGEREIHRYIGTTVGTMDIYVHLV